MKKLIWRISIAVLVFFPLACMGLMLLFIITKDCNHTGAEILDILLPLGLTNIIAIVLALFNYKNKAVRTALVLNVIAVLFFITVDQFNIMVQYDRWLERGLPEMFEMGVVNISVRGY